MMTVKRCVLTGLGLAMAMTLAVQAETNMLEKATFAGGCFWCMQPAYDRLTGIVEVVSGYMGGTGRDPTYEDYAQKGHLEAIQITYDPAKTTYTQLLNVYWRQIDPTDPGGQFVDRGPQYRAAIFCHTDEQKRLAEQSKKELEKSGRFDKPIVTEILKASDFYKAEEYHQDFHDKNPVRYKSYRDHSGRDPYLRNRWGSDREPPHALGDTPAANKLLERDREWKREQLRQQRSNRWDRDREPARDLGDTPADELLERDREWKREQLREQGDSQ